MKGQAALEFLMDYGWAILIIVVVVAALFAMRIFDPLAFINPEIKTCYIPSNNDIDNFCTGLGYENGWVSSVCGENKVNCHKTQNGLSNNTCEIYNEAIPIN